MIEDIRPIIEKVRKVVKLFRRSPTKNDLLQKYVQADHGKEIMLKLDTRTRWNSLYFMLKRFIELNTCICKSLIDLNSPINFRDTELELISAIVSSLLPVKLAVETLCRRDSTLLTADTTISFMLNNLGTGIINGSKKVYRI